MKTPRNQAPVAAPLALGALLALLAACAAPAPPAVHDTAASSRIVTDVPLGLSFSLPADWIAAPSGDAVIYSGVKGEESHATTITVQSFAMQGRGLGEALESSLAKVSGMPRFTLLWVEPDVIASHAALRYAFQVELYEQLRLRYGVLVASHGRFIDIAYAAVPQLFARGLPSFVHALETLELGWKD